MAYYSNFPWAYEYKWDTEEGKKYYEENKEEIHKHIEDSPHIWLGEIITMEMTFISYHNGNYYDGSRDWEEIRKLISTGAASMWCIIGHEDFLSGPILELDTQEEVDLTVEDVNDEFRYYSHFGNLPTNEEEALKDFVRALKPGTGLAVIPWNL